MIPKVIAYGWFGKKQKPESVLSCINSWKKYCPDYEIVELNENLLGGDSPLWVKQAYEQRMWAYVADYYRMKFMYEYGGITLDADVEIIKPLDKFLDHQFFSGQEINNQILITATMGSRPYHPFIGMILQYYRLMPFNPVPNTKFITGLIKVCNPKKEPNGSVTIPGVQLYPQEYFCPYNHRLRRATPTENTHTIHHFHGSWKEGKSA